MTLAEKLNHHNANTCVTKGVVEIEFEPSDFLDDYAAGNLEVCGPFKQILDL